MILDIMTKRRKEHLNINVSLMKSQGEPYSIEILKIVLLNQIQINSHRQIGIIITQIVFKFLDDASNDLHLTKRSTSHIPCVCCDEILYFALGGLKTASLQ